MGALAELVENAEAAQTRRDELVTRRDGAEAEFRSIVEGLRSDKGEDRDPDTKEAARCEELRGEIDSADETLAEIRKERKAIRRRIKEEKDNADDAKLIAESREHIRSVDSIADVTVTQGERMVYGVAPDGERSPNSFYMDLALRCKALFGGDFDHGASKRLTEYAHQVEVEYAERSKFGLAAAKQLRETIRGEDQSATASRMAEFEARGKTALELKPELRATAIGTDGGASATAPGEGSAFVTPVFEVGKYAPFREFGRAFADACQKEQLPPYGMYVYIPHVTGGSEVTGVTESSGSTTIADLAPTAGYLSGALKTFAGQVVISQQLLDRAGPGFAFDRLIFDQLMRNYALNFDTYVLEAALTEAKVNNWKGNAGAFVLMEVSAAKSAAAGGFYGQIAKAKADIRTLAGTVLNPTHLFVRPTRWEYIAAVADTTGRPLVVPDYAGPFNAAAGGSTSGDEGIEGATGYKLAGLPVFTDENIPDQGTTTNDQALVGCLDETWVFEGAITPRTIPQTKANTLQVILQQYSYATVIKRYAESVVAINGEGMKAVSYTD
jgi:HK97 family phage major capsid protein